MLYSYRASLVDLFTRVQRVRRRPVASANECLAIQETLIKRITYVEGRTRKARLKMKMLKAALVGSVATRPTKAVSKETKAEIKCCAELIEEYRRILGILREVGDALAFIYIDKWDIKPMAFKQPPGYLSGKRGNRLERGILRGIFERGGVAILNDLTNCLRYGDVTILWDGNLHIIEAKSGRGLNKRGKRQVRRNELLLEYLRTDRSVGLYEPDQPMHRRALDSDEVHHRDVLNSMLTEAIQHRGSYRKIEEGLHYIIETGDKLRTLPQAMELIHGQPVVAFVNEYKGCNVGYYPFTLSFEDPEALFAFYAGEILVLVAIDIDFVTRFLKGHGLSVSFLPRGDWTLQIVCDASGANEGWTIQVSKHFWGRLFGEFLGLDWFLSELVVRVRRDFSGER